MVFLMTMMGVVIVGSCLIDGPHVPQAGGLCLIEGPHVTFAADVFRFVGPHVSSRRFSFDCK